MKGINDYLSEQHCAIVGRTGAGKSYVAKTVIEYLLEQGRRVCIIDPTGAHWGLRSSASGKGNGFPIAVFGGEHGDMPISATSGAALAAIIAENNFPAIVDVSEMLIGQRHTFATDFFAELYRLNRKTLHLVIDEADEFAPQNPMPETKRLFHQVDRIVRRGRIRGFRVMFITQRPAVLHKNILTQANSLVAMRLTAPQDRKAVEEWVKGQADLKQGKEVLDTLARLQRGEGWVWCPEHDILKRHHFPKIKTFDSGRAPEDGEVIEGPTKITDIDLSAIREAFAEAEQEAADNDPKLLRNKIAELERKLSNTRAMTMDPRALENAHEAGRLLGRAEGWNDASKALSDKALSMIIPITNAPAKRGVSESSIPKGVITHQPKNNGNQSTGGITGPMQRILDTIGWMESIGVMEPEQTAVAFIAGYTIGGGAFNNPRGALRTMGLIDYHQGRILLTEAGRLTANKPNEALSTSELHRRVMDRLPGPEQRILNVLLKAYPNTVFNDDLARQAGYEPGGGAFNNPRGRLRTLRLLEYPKKGMVRASDFLFLS